MYIDGSAANAHHRKVFGEAFGYKDFIPQFTAAKFNASAWAELYRKAGAQYAGPVAEHADGFAMFDSEVSNFTCVKMGPKRDITGEIAAAVRAEGLRVITTMHHQWLWAWYPTWNTSLDTGNAAHQLTEAHGGLYGEHCSGPAEFDTPHTTSLFKDYFLHKVKEVVTKYQPDVLYFDEKLEQTMDDAHLLEVVSFFYNQAVRWNKGVALTYKEHDLHVNAGVLDVERGGFESTQNFSWQTGDSIDFDSWSWVEPPHLKNATLLIGELVDVVSKNGNLLLDIGPKSDGTIDDQVVTVLLRLGAWLKQNGMAIFKTRPWAYCCEGPTPVIPGGYHPWPLFTSTDFRFTASDGAVFITAFDYNNAAQSTYVVKTFGHLPVDVSDVTLVGGSIDRWWLTDAGLHIRVDTAPTFVDALVFRVHLGGSSVEDIDAPTLVIRQSI
jgi:alpha-L-fucosidase